MKQIIILITLLIVNSEKPMKKFSYSNENQKCIISYKENGELKIEFELSLRNNDGLEINEKGIATNPDSEGLASLEEFDPSGEFNPMEMFIYNSEKYFIKILIPLVELEDEYIGVTIENTEKNEIFNGMLTEIEK
jgi:hypothetical protein